MNRNRSILVSVLTSLALSLIPAGGALAEDAPAQAWDQEKVAQIAADLATAAADLRQVFRRSQGSAQIASGGARSQLRLSDLLRLIQSETRHLARELADGKGRDETEFAYQRLMMTIRDARENARRMFLHKDVLEAVDKTAALRQQLGAFYEAPASEPSES